MTNKNITFRCSTLLSIVLIVLFVLRLLMMYLSADLGSSYLVRQSIYTIAWLSLLLFFHNYVMIEVDEYPVKEDIQTMKKMTFLAMLACLCRVVTTVIYRWPIVTIEFFVSVNNILEIAAWSLLTIFFFAYWRMKCKQENI